ncbi:hypothetical protein ANK1_4140 [plant metagenome]|uniref:Uncharacterized protein n=1 Tax=plant metagenome TaxID=1297885 RepID=A0A484SHC1_9ZZZZ
MQHALESGIGGARQRDRGHGVDGQRAVAFAARCWYMQLFPIYLHMPISVKMNYSGR